MENLTFKVKAVVEHALILISVGSDRWYEARIQQAVRENLN